jgi:hypothetical protein
MADKFSRLVTRFRQQAYQPTQSGDAPSAREIAAFVNEAGFCVLTPRRETELPVLKLLARDNWHTVRDQLLTRRLLYYGRPFRRRTGVLSLHMLQALYNLSPAAKFNNDRFELYRTKFISADVNRLVGVITAKGPLNTRKLRRELGMAGEPSRYRFKRALIEAESKFLVTRADTTFLEGKHYTYLWGGFAQIYPEIAFQESAASDEESGIEIIEHYVNTVGATTAARISSMFGLYNQFVVYYAHQMVEAGRMYRYSSSGKEFLISAGMRHLLISASLIAEDNIPHG